MGRVAGEQRNARGVDFYRRYADDFELAAGLGNNAVRIGIEWARIEPERGRFDAGAVAHYREVIAAARARGLEPIVTIYHWVVPTWVQSPRDGVDLLSAPPRTRTSDRGRILESDFARRARAADDAPGREAGRSRDRWVVLNEPYSVLTASYITGAHPNGELLKLTKLRDAAINYIIGYAAAYDALAAADTVDADGDGRPTLIGNAMFGAATRPANPGSVAAAARMSYLVNDLMMTAWDSGALDGNFDRDHDDDDGPVPEGNYRKQLGDRLDFVGFNYYTTLRVVDCPGLGRLAAGDPQQQALAKNLSRAAPRSPWRTARSATAPSPSTRTACSRPCASMTATPTVGGDRSTCSKRPRRLRRPAALALPRRPPRAAGAGGRRGDPVAAYMPGR